ncbi:unnamed protein product [Taenia asiatica]|uniref:Peptidase S1 domain-containing protein n=1 Tax=Taenia asiatica TaxID=60517 RepID=A0A158R8N0_TAEAS|nr:unnamed protein product [Taenia asiatica]
MDQTTFETNSGMGSAFYNHNYHEMPERDYSAEMPRKNQGRHGSYSNPASPGYREMPPRDYNYNFQQGSAIRSNNGPRDGRPNVTYPPLPKKDYPNEISPGKRDKYVKATFYVIPVPTNGSIDGDKLNQLIELINQMPKFNNLPQNGEAQSTIHPHTAMENDGHGGNYLVPQLTFGPPNSDTVLVPNQRKKKFTWPKLRKNACQQTACHSNVQLNVCSTRGFGMDMTPRCSCSTYCDMDYYGGDTLTIDIHTDRRRMLSEENLQITEPNGPKNCDGALWIVGVDANINDYNKVDKGMNVDNQNFNTNGNGSKSNANTNASNTNNNNTNATNGGTCVLTGDVASTVVGLNSIAAINGLCASVNALNGALGGLSGCIGSKNFGAGVGGINGCVGAMNGGFGGGMEDTINSFSGGASTGRMIGRGGGYTGYIGGGDTFGGMGVRSSRVYGGSSGNLNAAFSVNVLRRLSPASYSRYGTSNAGSAYDIRYIERKHIFQIIFPSIYKHTRGDNAVICSQPNRFEKVLFVVPVADMDEYRQRVREAEEDAERRRQELIAKRDAEVAQKRQQAEYEVAQETARRKAKAEQMRKEEIKKKIAEAECTRKRKEQELMQLFCQKLKVLRDLEARRRAQYEKALMEANQRGAPIRQQIALTQRCIQEMEAYKAQIQAQECERKSHLAMLSRQLESICVPAYHADTGSEKNLLAEFCQKLSVIKCEENEKIIAAENTPMPVYEIRKSPYSHQLNPICCPPQPTYCCPMPTGVKEIRLFSALSFTVACYQPPPQPISYYCPPPPCCATYSQPVTPEPKSSPCGSTRTPSCCQKTRTAPVRKCSLAQNRHAVWQGNPKKFVLKMSFMNCSLQVRP